MSILLSAAVFGLLSLATGDGPITGESLSPSSREVAPTATATASNRYQLGPTDVVDLRVIAHPEFDASAAVTSRSTLILPILGEIDVLGLNVEQLQRRITELIDADYLADPQVLVQVSAYNNMKIWVFGQVERPGEILLRGPTNIAQLLNQVGLAKDSGDSLQIERRRPPPIAGADEEPEMLTVDLKALFRDGELSENIPVRNGDKIYVPMQAAKVSAFGEVGQPGFYSYREGMTLAELIQMAGGFTEFANQKKVKIKRPNQKEEIRVNIKDFFQKGDVEENVMLAEGDTIIVGSSFFF